MHTRTIASVLLWLCASIHAAPPALQLAQPYTGEIDLADYWVSEKLDGIRAYWNGTQLLSRGGHIIHAPTWFLAGLPAIALDGELWMARDRFEQLAATVRDTVPDESAWRQVRLMVFDAHLPALRFDQRLAVLRHWSAQPHPPHLALVEQYRVGDEAELFAHLAKVERGGGEGLMLHRGGAYYQAGRNDAVLKLKSYRDAEAVVMAQLPGKGRFRGLLGALRVQTPDGREFRLGTGFSDAQRRNPPALGSQVTYRYRGLTARGLPRFASFVRVRPAGE